ncbi:MAG: DUF4249 domain-containing protein [Bacteroidia bacterium]
MKNHQLLFFFIINFVLITGCTKKLEYDFKPQAPKLVISSILVPDSLIKVYVSSTQSILSNKNTTINNALVLLYEGNKVADTLVSKGNGLYTYANKHLALEGELYKIIAYANGFDSIFSEVTIPNTVMINSAHAICPYGYTQNNEPYTLFELTINDVPNEENFYELVLYLKQPRLPYQFATMADFKTNDNILINEGDIDYINYSSSLLISDKLFNGKTVTITCQFSNYNTQIGADKYFALRYVSQSYYKYKKYLLRHQYNQNTSSTLDDPLQLLFSGEPSNMYSNVKNGYGVFVGYNSTIEKVPFN